MSFSGGMFGGRETILPPEPARTRRPRRGGRQTILPPEPSLQGFGGLFAGGSVSATREAGVRSMFMPIANDLERAESDARKAQSNAARHGYNTLAKKTIANWIGEIRSLRKLVAEAGGAGSSWWR